MRRKFLLLVGVCFFLVGGLGLQILGTGQETETKKAAGPSTPLGVNTPWAIDVTNIEACSCLLFCPCYLNAKAHHDFCEFNIAGLVNDGQVGEVSLAGARYWLSGDLGDEWGTTGKSGWLVITFDPRVTPEQRDALVNVLTKIYPVEWAEVQLDEAKITWWIGRDQAWARLGNGKGEMVLEPYAGADGGKVALHNINYFGAQQNRGFVFYKSKVHRWEGFGHEFSYSGRNAFTIRIEASGTL